MGDFNRKGSFGGGRNFRGGGGNRRFGGRGNFNRGPREMHKTNCSKCKKECEVPFKPTEGRPVYCRDCFQKIRDNPDEAVETEKSESKEESEDSDEDFDEEESEDEED